MFGIFQKKEGASQSHVVTSINESRFTNEEKMKAACSLNLLTVSVSQIIDYEDRNILDMEYDAILNNLNLQNINHSEHLLNVFKQLLDVITFYRIEKKERQFIEAEYQRKMKSAIWNAVPNFALILSTPNVGAMAVALATQVGVGYMNYRKEKANAGLDKNKELWQLERSAIEQLNGLRRELFAAAWNIAKEYDFPDKWRLTEHQIKEYNAILMESDPIKRYQALNHIKDNFEAYYPFWYEFAHAAKEVFDNTDRLFPNSEHFPIDKVKEIQESFKGNALEHYMHFYEDPNTHTQNPDLLREDIIYSSCALEQIPLIEDENQKKELLKKAQNHVGNNKDILQLIVLNQIALKDYVSAQKNLLHLVNSGYNVELNAQILGGIYEHESLENEYYLLKRNLSLTSQDYVLKPYKQPINYFEQIEILKHDVINFECCFKNYYCEVLCRIIADPYYKTCNNNLLETYKSKEELVQEAYKNLKDNKGFDKEEFLNRYIELINDSLIKFKQSSLFTDKFDSACEQMNTYINSLFIQLNSPDFDEKEFIEKSIHSYFAKSFTNIKECAQEFLNLINTLTERINDLLPNPNSYSEGNPYKEIKDGLEYLYDAFEFPLQPYADEKNLITTQESKQFLLNANNLVSSKNKSTIASIVENIKSEITGVGCKVFDRKNKEMHDIYSEIVHHERLRPYYAIELKENVYLLLFEDHIVYFEHNKLMNRYMLCLYKDIHYTYKNDKLVIDCMTSVNRSGSAILFVSGLLIAYGAYITLSNIKIDDEKKDIIGKLLNKLRDSL